MSFFMFLGGEAVVGEGSCEFFHVFRRGSRSWRVCVGFGEGSRRVGEGNWDFVICLRGNFFFVEKIHDLFYFKEKRVEK